MNKKILVALGDFLGCGYYRCGIPFKELSENYNFDFTLTNYITPEITQKYDALVLQRQHAEGVLKNIEVYKQLRPDGKIIFEVDDNLHDLPASNPVKGLYYHGSEATSNMEKMLKISDLMTVSTESLKREYTKHINNIHVCYNSFDPKILSQLEDIEKITVDPDRLRIGWAGSSTHVDDFKEIMKPLLEIMYEFPKVDFVFIGPSMMGLFPRNLHSRIKNMGDTFPRDAKGNPAQWGEKNPTIEYYKLLIKSNLDIAIAPIQSVVFNSCKSYIKLIEYGIAGIPFVASNFGPYAKFVGHNSWFDRANQVGLTAESNSEWKKALRELINNHSLRDTLRENNKNNVLKNHSIKSNISNWISAYKSIGLESGDEPGKYEENIDKDHNLVPKASKQPLFSK